MKTAYGEAEEAVLEYPIFTENGYEYTCCVYSKICTFLLAKRFVTKIICSESTEKLIYNTTKYYKRSNNKDYIKDSLLGKLHGCPIYNGDISYLCVKIVF